MKSGKSRLLSITTGMFLLAIGTTVGWWWGQHGTVSKMRAESMVESEQRPVLYWYDPMSPQHHFDQPGKSPFMDMELVPKYASSDAAVDQADNGVRIDARVAQNIGMREAVVERIALTSVIEATGILTFNERDVAIEQVRSAGLVERVWPLAPGDVITAGQPLVELLVPAWAAAQSEFLALRAGADPALVNAARERLRIIGLPAAQIEELEKSGRARQSFILHSARSGVLESLDVRSGMALMAGQTIAKIQGIDNIWLEVAVPENRAGAVRLGGDAQVALAAYPELSFTGKIIAVLPELAASSRTLRVRIELPNPLGRLRAGMSAQVRLADNSGEVALAVPTEAVIRTGTRALVMAVQEHGRFTPVQIELGPEIDNRTVVTAGLVEGQRIVASAQFLLDSEASLSSGIAPDTPAPASTPLDPHDGINFTGEQP